MGLLLKVAPPTAWAIKEDSHTPLQAALRANRISTARALLGASPAAEVLAALQAAGPPALPLFADFLLSPGRLPLGAAGWAFVPSPCPGIERTLPAAMARSVDQAAQVVQHLEAADAARLRTAALCLWRLDLPSAVVETILVNLFSQMLLLA